MSSTHTFDQFDKPKKSNVYIINKQEESRISTKINSIITNKTLMKDIEDKMKDCVKMNEENEKKKTKKKKKKKRKKRKKEKKRKRESDQCIW